jgi:hypothetical protein
MQPEIRYAKSGDVHIAYQVFGAGSLDLVYIPGFISNIETYWERPEFAAWLHRIGTRARVIGYSGDRRSPCSAHYGRGRGGRSGRFENSKGPRRRTIEAAAKDSLNHLRPRLIKERAPCIASLL